MAKESVKILQGKLDVESLISQLNAALAEEWLAYYQYWIGALVFVVFSSLFQPENKNLYPFRNCPDLGAKPRKNPSSFHYRQLPAFFYSLPRGSLKTATVA